jgi:lactoylglutathione lyase
MKIAHVALWTRDLDRSAEFYKDTFDAEIGSKYHSKRREGFVSQFAKLKDGPSIELMTLPTLRDGLINREDTVGWTHIAISVGSEEAVREIAGKLELLGMLISAPRLTGDGFYEAVVQDPDGNLVEITA